MGKSDGGSTGGVLSRLLKAGKKADSTFKRRPVGAARQPCSPSAPAQPPQQAKSPKLVSITVVRHATQQNVTGPKNWAAVKKATDEVIVEATTAPNTADAWRQIKWSADSGKAVPGKPNQRKLSRATSKKHHVEAELGGVKDHVDVWILWATIVVLMKDKTPPNAVQFGRHVYDGTEKLGAVAYDNDRKAAGKVIPVAKITPAGVHRVVKSGWAFKRQIKAHVWTNGTKFTSDRRGRFWKNNWVDDTSAATHQKLKPDAGDKIYDNDAPNIGSYESDADGLVNVDTEAYHNFRQWIEWNVAGFWPVYEKCSDYAYWYFGGRWKKGASPPVQLIEVKPSNPPLPQKSYYHP